MVVSSVIYWHLGWHVGSPGKILDVCFGRRWFVSYPFVAYRFVACRIVTYRFVACRIVTSGTSGFQSSPFGS